MGGASAPIDDASGLKPLPQDPRRSRSYNDPMTQPTLHLVDASMYVFRAWHSMPDEFHDADGWPTNAVHGFARFLLELLERERPRHIAIAFDEALKRGEEPMRAFMLKQTRQADVMLFARLAKLPAEVKGEDVPLRVLLPAFVTSELKTAFQIGFMIFIPFLIIDMIVASVLMSLGMMMLSPVLVALPFKLMLFVLADGWNLLIGSLAASFAT